MDDSSFDCQANVVKEYVLMTMLPFSVPERDRPDHIQCWL